MRYGVELGHHPLKGVRTPIRVFTLASAMSEAAPSRESSG
jgi:hypothetical protein